MQALSNLQHAYINDADDNDDEDLLLSQLFDADLQLPSLTPVTINKQSQNGMIWFCN